MQFEMSLYCSYKKVSHRRYLKRNIVLYTDENEIQNSYCFKEVVVYRFHFWIGWSASVNEERNLWRTSETNLLHKPRSSGMGIYEKRYHRS